MKKINKYKLISVIIVALVAIVSTYFTDKTHIPTKTENEIFVHFIDVGEADSAFIEFPDGKTMLIDAGETENGEEVASYIKSRNCDKIDFVIGTHPHADHIGGLKYIITEFETGEIYMPKIQQNTDIFEKLLLAIKNKNKTVISPTTGQVIYETEDLTVKVLSPKNQKYSSLNDYSIVIKIDYKDTSFLFMGDAENEAISQIKESVSADILKVAHHGSYSSGDSSFMKRVNPKYAVISVGENNQYGHPHWEILQLLKEVNAKVYRTDQDGTVVITSDGENIEVITLGGKNESNN